jgi:hypothetical protein
MKLPNSDRAIIAPDKLRDYLLNPRHPRGASKAKLLLSMGFRTPEWQVLERAIREQHLSAEVAATVETDYGRRFEILAPLAGPDSRPVIFRSIWQIDIGGDVPRLITIYPE